MQVTQFDRLSSSVDIINLVVDLFSWFRTSKMLMIPIRFPVKICNAIRSMKLNVAVAK